jgi:DNA-directed RNA polymerase subunit RPC12/RpoP
MRKKDPTFLAFGKVLCSLFGHKFTVSKNVTDHIHEYRCTNCGMEMTDTANGLLARLTPKFKETNEYLAKIHKRRKNRCFAEAS